MFSYFIPSLYNRSNSWIRIIIFLLEFLMIKNCLFIAAILFVFICSGCGDISISSEMSSPGRYILDEPVTYVTDLDYIAYVPEDYGKDPAKKWPLVMFLHGVGERGTDVNVVENTGLPALAARGDKFDFILIAPQCPPGQFWPNLCDPLLALVDDAQKRWNIDVDRLYLTGLSMGGFGSWSLACHSPETFAAVAPICGGGPSWMAACLKDVPIWAFHGEKDNVVPVGNTKVMIEAIEKAGGKPKVTYYPELGHDSWTVTYANPELYEWMLAQSKK